jgi:RimJ/RimL family protein N-acetyltransferase
MNEISFSEKAAEPSENSFQIKEKMNIRRAGALEAEQLTRVALASKNYWKYPDSWIAEWRESLTITPDFVFWNDVFAATIGEKIIGFYALVAEKGKFRLEHFWIEPEFIGKGIGRCLLRHAVRRAIELDAKTIEIVSDPNAEKFYKKAGATRIGEEITEIKGERRILPRLEIKTKGLKV